MSAIFSSRLRSCRDSLKLSQSEVCRAIGVKQGTYSTWEIGKHEPPYDILVKIATLFNVPTDYLLGVVESQFPTDKLGKVEELKAAIRSVIDSF